MKKEASAFKYLSIRKKNKYWKFSQGDLVLLLFRKSREVLPGIIGFCKVAGEILLTRDIDKEEREYCYNRSFLQLPVAGIHCFDNQNLIDEEVLNALHIMNRYGKYRLFEECSMVQIPSNIITVLSDYSRFWHIWRMSQNDGNIKGFKRLFIHLQNENIVFKKYFSMIRGVTRCETCGIEHKASEKYTLPFFELHDTAKHEFGKYKEPDYQKYIPLCGNCHKKEHEKIVLEEVSKSQTNYCERDTNHFITGWNVKYFENKIK